MDQQPPRPFPQVGRNDPCPCGSGKKYKRCCLPKHLVEQPAAQTKEKVEVLTDRWLPGQEYVKAVGYPLTKFDQFLLDKGFHLQDFPEVLQQPLALNFFHLEFEKLVGHPLAARVGEPVARRAG